MTSSHYDIIHYDIITITSNNSRSLYNSLTGYHIVMTTRAKTNILNANERIILLTNKYWNVLLAITIN